MAKVSGSKAGEGDRFSTRAGAQPRGAAPTESTPLSPSSQPHGAAHRLRCFADPGPDSGGGRRRSGERPGLGPGALSRGRPGAGGSRQRRHRRICRAAASWPSPKATTLPWSPPVVRDRSIWWWWGPRRRWRQASPTVSGQGARRLRPRGRWRPAGGQQALGQGADGGSGCPDGGLLARQPSTAGAGGP